MAKPFEKCADCGLVDVSALRHLYGADWFQRHVHAIKATPPPEKKEVYPTCPYCGHAAYHKTYSCEDTCCSGCPEENDDGVACDCQYTVNDIDGALSERL